MPNPEQSPYICWIDLETTGSAENDALIEIGAVMTDRQLSELSSFHRVINIGLYDDWILRMDPFVVNMHTVNGLLSELKDGVYLDQAEDQMIAWIRQFTKGDHIPLAGSGVAHFDHPIIQRKMPKFNKYLAYWPYDIGVLRRMLRLFGLPVPDRKADLNHRALDDIRDHIEEAKVLRAMIRDAWGALTLREARNFGNYISPDMHLLVGPLGGDGQPI